jgi:hypothetical protein
MMLIFPITIMSPHTKRKYRRRKIEKEEKKIQILRP